MSRLNRFTSVAAIAAAFSMAATPAAAAEMPMPAAPSAPAEAGQAVFDADAMNAERHRRYRYRHRNRVDAGDVIAGVLVLGTIAAIAGAGSKNRRDDRRYRNRDYRGGDYRNGDYRYRGDSRMGSSMASGGIERATSSCVREIERDVRVESVDSVDRNGDGWNVRGRIYDGQGFSCQVDSDGRVSGVNFGGRMSSNDRDFEDRQWDDDRYASARRNAEMAGTITGPDRDYPGADDGQPPEEYAYPGA